MDETLSTSPDPIGSLTLAELQERYLLLSDVRNAELLLFVNTMNHHNNALARAASAQAACDAMHEKCVALSEKLNAANAELAALRAEKVVQAPTRKFQIGDRVKITSSGMIATVVAPTGYALQFSDGSVSERNWRENELILVTPAPEGGAE